MLSRSSSFIGCRRRKTADAASTVATSSRRYRWPEDGTLLRQCVRLGPLVYGFTCSNSHSRISTLAYAGTQAKWAIG